MFGFKSQALKDAERALANMERHAADLRKEAKHLECGREEWRAGYLRHLDRLREVCKWLNVDPEPIDGIETRLTDAIRGLQLANTEMTARYEQAADKAEKLHIRINSLIYVGTAEEEADTVLEPPRKGELTEMEDECLGAVVDFIHRTGHSPTQLGVALWIGKSRSTAKRLLVSLREKGWISAENNKHRSIKVL